MKTNYTTKELKAQLRQGECAWPGGYPLFFIASDGEALSFEAVRDNLKSVIHSMRYEINDDWRIIGCEVNWEYPSLFCAHTNKRIESAYAEEANA
jgi:hypothetical protein